MLDIKYQDGNARVGFLKTKSFRCKTPMFMPVATKGAVKLITTKELEDMGVQSIISNAFLLYMRPGLKVINSHNGLHYFMHWKRAIFTDSGGFQILSMNETFLKEITDEGIIFKSPFDGKKETLTPKKAIEIQMSLGSDVAMCLDHMPLYKSTKEQIIQATNRTHKWARECIKYHTDKEQLLFGIAQGGTYKDLRIKSVKTLNKMKFDGIALGGLCIGESKEEMYSMVKSSIPHIEKNKARYLMGVGSPPDILECISMGIDIFDSVFPTRNARHGNIFTHNGPINIENGIYKNDYSPIDNECKCDVCKKHTRAYLNHLIRTSEPLALRLLSYHNLFFLQQLMKDAQKHIKKGDFLEFKENFCNDYQKK